MVVNDVYYGFKLVEQIKINEINSVAQRYVHEKTGAKLIFIENDDENKVFSVTFRTPPSDSTGVAHILEHSVLCGSDKFPVKEPFVELAKGSLNTFLNAMTFGDKTMYPVASTNDKDFKNLMDVYLDAVFFPNIYKDKFIFMQEGWHYNLETLDAPLEYKGVVYNEMKGAYSAPESMLFRKISETLFPDTTYGYDSGGDPVDIPNLTYENFIDFHKKYYHPSNSYFYLYGKLDILEKLKYIDENYLSKFEMKKVDSKIPYQKPLGEMKEVKTYYSAAKDEPTEGKSFIALNYVVGDALNERLNFAMEILDYVLVEMQGAPVKKALVEAGIGEDVFAVYDNSSLQPAFSIVVKNAKEQDKERFKSIVIETLKKQVKDGIDKKALEGTINRKEFELREGDYRSYPKGLIYNMKIMDSWLYEGEPYIHIKYEKILQEIKDGVNNGFFEHVVNEFILNSNHCSMLIVNPKQGLEEEENKKLIDKLQQYKSTLSEDKLKEIIEDTKNLEVKQNTSDTKEKLATIPSLKLNDIKKDIEPLYASEKDVNNINVIYSEQFTNKILYTDLIFKTKNIKEEDVPYLTILARVLGALDTKNYTYEELVKEINLHTGGIEYGSNAYFFSDRPKEYLPYLHLKGKAVIGKVEDLYNLMSEVMFNTKFDNKKRLKEIIDEMKSRIEMSLNNKGHIVAAFRALSYSSDNSKYLELVSGLEFYRALSKIQKNFESESDKLVEKLQSICKEVFNKDNLVVGVIAGNEEYNEFEKNFNIISSKLGNKEYKEETYNFSTFNNYSEGLTTAGKVQYVAKAGNFVESGYNYNGSMLVLKSILSLDYLWNSVRVKGGAYGAFATFAKSGNMFFASYRDPNLKETINTFNKAKDYIKNFDVDETEMTKYIIGTISELDTPLTPSMKGDKAISNHIRKVKNEELQKERDEILSTNPDKIKELSPLVEKIMDLDNICVVGNEEKINSNKDLFKEIKKLVD